MAAVPEEFRSIQLTGKERPLLEARSPPKDAWAALRPETRVEEQPVGTPESPEEEAVAKAMDSFDWTSFLVPREKLSQSMTT